MAKNKGGRPTVMTEEVLRKLEEAFLMGCTDVEACLYADIGQRTLYDYQEANPEYSQRKEVLKSNPIMLAKGIQLDRLKAKDSVIAQKVIDRKEGSKLTVQGGDKPITIDTPWSVNPVRVSERES